MIFRATKSGLINARQERIQRKPMGSVKDYNEIVCSEYSDFTEYRMRAMDITYR